MSQTAPLRAWSGRTLDVRIANPPPSLLAKYTAREKGFFSDYADFVVKLVRDPTVTEKLEQIFATEHVILERPVDIRVMVFPARSLPGRSTRVLHGSYSQSASQISLYPLRVPRDWIRHEGFDLFRARYHSLSIRNKKLIFQASQTAVSTLVHEVLHAKFEGRGMARYSEEALVRKLESQYMEGWDETITEAIERASIDS